MKYGKASKRLKVDIERAKVDYEIKGDIIFYPAAKFCLVLKGPAGSIFDHGFFDIEFSVDLATYPFEAPRVLFKSHIYHPNIDDGHICVDFLGSEWTPALTIGSIMRSLEQLLTDPNPDSPLNGEAARDFKERPETYRQINENLIKVGKDTRFQKDENADKHNN